MSKDKYSDRERIDLFLERVEKMKNNSLIRDERLTRVRFMTSYNEKKGTWFALLDAENEPINMESFESLVAVFRLIYMEKEPTYINEVYNVVDNALRSDERHRIVYFKQNWQQALDEDSHLVAEDGSFMKLDKVLKNWLYGEVFHSDKAKREFVKRWGKPLEVEVVLIINFLCHYIFWLGNFIEECLSQNLIQFSN